MTPEKLTELQGLINSMLSELDNDEYIYIQSKNNYLQLGKSDFINVEFVRTTSKVLKSKNNIYGQGRPNGFFTAGMVNK